MLAQKTKIFKEGQEEEVFLWNQLRSGEKHGLEKLYLKYLQDLFRYGMAIKPNRSFIKDCIQELFIDLWKYRQKLSGTDNVKLYLFRALSNRIGKEVSRDLRKFREEEYAGYETVFLEESAEEKLINSQRNEHIQLKLNEALENLPIRQREVIRLLFFEKLSYEDTSLILGISIDSSYTLAWKAISRMKKSILMVTILFIYF